MTPAPDTPDLATMTLYAATWHGAVEAICTILGVGGGLGASEAIEAVRAHDAAQAARIRKLEAEVAGLKSLMWPESITAQVGYTSCAVCGTAHHAADECPRCDLESVASRLA